jgi:hypothetical protein
MPMLTVPPLSRAGSLPQEKAVLQKIVFRHGLNLRPMRSVLSMRP